MTNTQQSELIATLTILVVAAIICIVLVSKFDINKDDFWQMIALFLIGLVVGLLLSVAILWGASSKKTISSQDIKIIYWVFGVLAGIFFFLTFWCIHSAVYSNFGTILQQNEAAKLGTFFWELCSMCLGVIAGCAIVQAIEG
jgi:hypothetical protein